MKLAFSTLGCPDWSFSEIYATAKDMGFDGIEVRGISNELYVPKIRAFDGEHIEKTKAKLAEHGVTIPMLTSGISIGKDNENAVKEACEYMDLAEKLGSQFVRIMISNQPYPEQVDIETAKRLYNEMCEYGEKRGVTPLIETNGVLADSTVMKKFIEEIASKNKGILWDVHHPFRYFGETAQFTAEQIGEYVKYIHVKDSIMRDDKLVYRMMGYGDVPVFDAVKEAHEAGYNGYISLEWVKRWNPDLESAGIVFAHFISFMKFLFTRL